MPELKIRFISIERQGYIKIVEYIPHPVAILGKGEICDFNAKRPCIRTEGVTQFNGLRHLQPANARIGKMIDR